MHGVDLLVDDFPNRGRLISGKHIAATLARKPEAHQNWNQENT
jgi:hypothetical protein